MHYPAIKLHPSRTEYTEINIHCLVWLGSTIQYTAVWGPRNFCKHPNCYRIIEFYTQRLHLGWEAFRGALNVTDLTAQLKLLLRE